MKLLPKRDVFSSIITGVITGFIAWRIFTFLESPGILGFSLAWLMLILPFVWMLFVLLGHKIGQWVPFFSQFGRFTVIGFGNSGIDFGVLYGLIALTGVARGPLFPVFKSVSFLFAMVHSYLWNKHWTFESVHSVGGLTEFFRFFGTTLFGWLVNVLIAYLVVDFVGGPHFGLSQNAWAGVAAAAGALSGLAFSFVGLKLVVFKK